MTKIRKKPLLLFCFAFVTLGICLAVFISSALTRPVSTMAPATSARPEFEVHFISLAKSQIEQSALSLAPDFQAIGAGGYVWKIGDYYHVLSSGFENKNDATRVQSNLDSTFNIKSEIVSIKFDGLTINGNFNADEKKVLARALGSFRAAYQSLFDIAISLDTLVYNEISARLEINALEASIAGIKADFDTLFSQIQNAELEALGKALENEQNILKALCTGIKINDGQTFPSLIKYRYIELLNKCL